MSSSRFKKRRLAAAGCIAGVIMAAAACSSSGSSSNGSSNTFNVIVIGRYEAPLFAKAAWLDNLSAQFIPSDPSYDAADLLPPVAKSLSYNGSLYAVPFYGDSSMLYYNKALLGR
jgi:sorbitol/mannitol transport system substrate-binding protein